MARPIAVAADPDVLRSDEGDPRWSMRAFTCPVCRHLVTFENTQCLNCGTELGFDWDARTFVAGGGCANRTLIGCNGVSKWGLCRVCLLTRTRPPDAALGQFAAAE